VGLAILCPITSQVKGYPFEVTTPAGSRISGAILADQLKTLDWRVRQAEFICKLPRETTSLPRADKSFTTTRSDDVAA
jgi:mRNA interferase MazF